MPLNARHAAGLYAGHPPTPSQPQRRPVSAEPAQTGLFLLLKGYRVVFQGQQSELSVLQPQRARRSFLTSHKPGIPSHGTKELGCGWNSMTGPLSSAEGLQRKPALQAQPQTSPAFPDPFKSTRALRGGDRFEPRLLSFSASGFCGHRSASPCSVTLPGPSGAGGPLSAQAKNLGSLLT